MRTDSTVLDQLFAFKIGDFVKLPGPPGSTMPRNMFRITDRHAHECSGGVQLSYTMQVYFDRSRPPIKAFEFELAPWTEEDSRREEEWMERKIAEAYDKERKRYHAVYLLQEAQRRVSVCHL